jgi:hypothetical protein
MHGWKGNQPKDRTRFFTAIADKGSVPLAALVFYVAVCRATKKRPRVWTARQLGKQIGLGQWQVRQLLRQAKQAGLVDYKRTTVGFRVWASEEFEGGWLKAWRANGCEDGFGHYRLSTAKEYGYTGSVLLELLDPEPQDKLMVADCGIEIGYERSITVSKACELFVWMRAKTVRRALRRLAKDGWLGCVNPKLVGLEERFVLKKSRWGKIVPDPLVLNQVCDRLVAQPCHKHEVKRLREERKALCEELVKVKGKLATNHERIRELSVDESLLQELSDP